MPTCSESRLRALDRAGEAQVDHPRRATHHEVARLQVEVDPALLRHVVDHRRRPQAERRHLLGRQRAAALDQPPKRRPLQVLHQDVRVLALQAGLEPAQEHRVRQRLERLPLAPQGPQRVLLPHQVRPQYLGDHHREARLVPDPVDLVALAPAERLERGPAGGDLVPLGPLPRLLVRHDLPHLAESGAHDRLRTHRRAATDPRDRARIQRQGDRSPRARQRSQRAFRHRAREEDGRHGLPRRDRAGGVRRPRRGLPDLRPDRRGDRPERLRDAHGRIGRDLARVLVARSLGHRGAEGALAAGAVLGRGARVLRAHRA